MGAVQAKKYRFLPRLVLVNTAVVHMMIATSLKPVFMTIPPAHALLVGFGVSRRKIMVSHARQRGQRLILPNHMTSRMLSSARFSNDGGRRYQGSILNATTTQIETPRPRHAESLSTIVGDSSSNTSGLVSSPHPTLSDKTPPFPPRIGQQQQQRLSTSLSRPFPLPPPSPNEFPKWAHEQPRSFFRFEILHESTKSMARVGRLHTPHGVVDPPGFVAVATNGALKGVDYRDAQHANQQLIFCNTYHLLLHPGVEVIRDAGGLHKWTNRQGCGGGGGGGGGPFITDSGGFQVFSLAYGSVQEELSSGGELKRADAQGLNRKWRHDIMGNDAVRVTEEGVTFRSYRDGSHFLLTPESTVQAQKAIGADIIIPLDELPPYHIDREKLADSVERTHRWQARSLFEHLKDVKDQAMFAVIHGGIDVELRTKSVEYLTSLPFDGYAIGGSLGNGREELKDLLTWMMPLFDEKQRRDKPRHLLGIADEESIRNVVPLGIDTMDSCYPTRLGRHGTLMTRQGLLRIKRQKHARSYGAKIDDECNCKTCQLYDRAYLCHLFKANEPLAVTLGTQHNIHYMNDLMAQLRLDISENKI